MGKTVYFDCETHLISPDNPVPRRVCLQYAVGDGPVHIVLAQDGAVEIAREWLTNTVEYDTIVSHNGFFDWSVLGLDPWEAMEAGRVRDTLIMSQLHAIEFDWMRANPADNWAPPDFSLACLAWTFCDERLEKGADTWRLRYAELENTPPWLWPPAAVEYAEKDVTILRRVFHAITAGGWSCPDEARQTTTAWCLRLMEIWGITTSPAAVERLKAIVEPARKEAVEHLLACGLMSPGERTLDTERRERAILARDPNPPRTPTGRIATGAAYMKSLGLPTDREAWLGPPGPPKKNLSVIRERVRRWYESKGLDVPETEKGSDSTERAVLAATDDPDLLVLAGVGEVEKITTTYMPVFERRKNHPRWNCLVATGRVSVSKPNLNNIPRELFVGGKKHSIVREVFAARPGYVYIDADYSQAELCALAQVTWEMFGHSAMREVIVAGKDLHVWIACLLLDIPYEEGWRRHEAKDPKFKDYRTLAKALNFGLPGGLGPKKFVQFALDTYGVVLTIERARELKELWLEAFPEVRRMFAWVNGHLQGAASSFTLEQLRSGRRRGGCGYCDGNNSLFQGLTADGAKAALRLVTNECYRVPTSPLYGSRVVAFIYDEILLETPEDRVGPAGERLHELMVEGMKWATPDVPVVATMEAMYHWTKNAKEVRDPETGWIVPFDRRLDEYETS